MRFTPVTPERLVQVLAGWIQDLDQAHPRIGFDGAGQIGAGTLADAVADRLQATGRQAIRVSTAWWWRPASLRLELGRTDVDMLLGGWVDGSALCREVLHPLGPGGSGSYLRQFRDPHTDRSVRGVRVHAADRAALLLDGPFLLADDLPLDAVVYLQVSAATMARALPAEKAWWVDGLDAYLHRHRPVEAAAVVVAYDHPAAPAVAWPGADRS